MYLFLFFRFDMSKVVSTWQRVVAAFGLVAVLYVLLSKLGVFSFSPELGSATSLGAIFVIGLVAAFSSCTAVVGGLVAAVSARRAQENTTASIERRMRPHLLFNLGRILGFAVLGALIGLLGSAFQFSSTMNGALMVAVSLFMIGLGLQLMGITPLAAIRPPKRLAHWVHDLSESEKPWVPLVLGAATFFLPCGFTQSIQLLAMSTGSPLQAGLMMTVFALGTLPALLGIGYATSTAKGKSVAQLTYFVGAFVIALGIANVVNGATLLGFTGFTSPSVEESSNATVTDGVQVVEMAVKSSGVYSPSTLRVQKGVPVRWVVNRDDWVGCANSLVLPAFGINERLSPGENIIEFTPSRAGTFAFSCAMGMVRGTMIVE